MAKAKEKAIDEKQKEAARSTEIEEMRKSSSRGLEKKRADGGVSFLYDQPQIIEKYQEERDKVGCEEHMRSKINLFLAS